MELLLEGSQEGFINEQHFAFLLNQISKLKKDLENLVTEKKMLEEQLSKIKVNGYMYEDVYGTLSMFVPEDRIQTMMELGYRMYKDKVFEVCPSPDGRFNHFNTLCRDVDFHSFFYHNYSHITGGCISRRFYESCLTRIFNKDEKKLRSGMNNVRLRVPTGKFADYSQTISKLSIL